MHECSSCQSQPSWFTHSFALLCMLEAAAPSVQLTYLRALTTQNATHSAASWHHEAARPVVLGTTNKVCAPCGGVGAVRPSMP